MCSTPIPPAATDSEAYSVASNGTYSNPSVMNYVVGADGVRIGSGIGPYLGINVALLPPSFSGSGVYLNPAGIVNTASFAPFTAGIAPGDFITLYGANLAPGTATAYTVPFPTTAGLDGVQVTVNGLPAPVQFVSPGQISVLRAVCRRVFDCRISGEQQRRPLECR